MTISTFLYLKNFFHYFFIEFEGGGENADVSTVELEIHIYIHLDIISRLIQKIWRCAIMLKVLRGGRLMSESMRRSEGLKKCSSSKN